MISKDRLLAGLEEAIHVEEGMVTLYANFSKALVKEADDISAEKKEKIAKMLSRLHRDSTRHKEMIDKMTEDIRRGAVNEY